MQALSILSRSVFGLLRIFRPGMWSLAKSELPHEYLLWDAQGSARCGNPARSWRLLSDWIASRGNKLEDYKWLSAHISSWEDTRLISWLTEARVARLFALRHSAEALNLLTRRLSVDPLFRPRSAADTLSLAQTAARGGAERISRILLSDFSARFPGDPRVSVSDALRRRLTQPTPERMRA
jgi:hypothetical protein